MSYQIKNWKKKIWHQTGYPNNLATDKVSAIFLKCSFHVGHWFGNTNVIWSTLDIFWSFPILNVYWYLGTLFFAKVIQHQNTFKHYNSVNANKRNQKLINVAQFFLLSDNIARTHLLILLFYDKVIKQQCSITHGSFKGLCFVSALAETASRSQDLCC